jgi:hypothetical protein
MKICEYVRGWGRFPLQAHSTEQTEIHRQARDHECLKFRSCCQPYFSFQRTMQLFLGFPGEMKSGGLLTVGLVFKTVLL